MIRVLHYGLSSNLGGIESYLYKLYKNIDKKEFKFDFLIVGNKKPCWHDEFSEMGSEFYTIIPRSRNLSKNKKELKKIFNENEFDIVHCHMNSLSYIKPISLALKSNNTVIVHSRNAHSPKSIKTKILHKINMRFLQKKKVMKLAVSDLAGEWMFGNKSHYTVLNNGVDIQKFKFDKDSRKKLRKELCINDKYCVIHIGAFRPQKNHLFLLKTFQNIIKSRPNSLLILVGAGPLMLEFERQAKEMGIRDKILLLGNRGDIRDLLSASDIFLFPSFYEGFPNAVLEAETSGLPCLISSEITNQVKINSNCYSLPLSIGPEKWAEKVLSINNNNERSLSSEFIMSKGFSVKDEVRKIESIYYDLKKNKK